MGNETKSNGASNRRGGLRAKMEHYVYSEEKKHVLAGIGIFTGIPWYLLNQDCLNKWSLMIPEDESQWFIFDQNIGLTKITWKRLADKARKARLSSSSSSDK
ncbi:hypothetical protein Bca52824_025216 [Brassica carinata]|uniref:Uncharacterized protein n=1 Tax=Brassica carinata TaxID=52824 RepID=A0A8X8AUN3_BRACI|nr:hypothetical protein Bca52824_025216 [Brassica carinata]